MEIKQGLNTENLLHQIEKAMLKNVPCPYTTTQEEMYLRIQNHVTDIYRQACEQLEQDMISHVNGRLRLNVEELSEYEINMLSDAEDNMGYY